MTLEALKAMVAAPTNNERQVPTLYEQVHSLAELVAASTPDGAVDDVSSFLTTAYSVLRNNSTLTACTWGSISGAIMTGARLGLSFSPELGHAWLIPRKIRGQWTAVFQLGYRGVLELARRSGRVGTVRTGFVYDWADVDAVEGTDSRLIIRRDWSKPHGDPVGYWCVVEMLDGSRPAWSLLTRAEVDEIRARIPGAEDSRSAWSAHFDSMAQVAAFRRLRSVLPLSVELEQALAVDGTVQVMRTGAPVPALDVPALGSPVVESGSFDDVPDGEPFGDVHELPDGPGDAQPASDEVGTEQLAGEEAADTDVGTRSAVSVSDASEPAPRPRMVDLRAWARTHRLTTVIQNERTIGGCVALLAGHLAVDDAEIERLIAANEAPPPMPEEVDA